MTEEQKTNPTLADIEQQMLDLMRQSSEKSGLTISEWIIKRLHGAADAAFTTAKEAADRAEQKPDLAARRSATPSPVVGASVEVPEVAELHKLIRDMLPLIEPARLREEAAAAEGIISRMPVRQLVRRASAMLSVSPEAPGQERG